MNPDAPFDDQDTSIRNPIDELEEFINTQNIPYVRYGSNEILIQYPNSWQNLQSFWSWDPEFQCLDVSASSQFNFHPDQRTMLYKLLSLINNQLWVGHFDLSDEDSPTYRHTLLLRDLAGPVIPVIEDLLAIVLTEYQRFFPAFEYVIKNNKDPEEALSLSLIDTQGEA